MPGFRVSEHEHWRHAAPRHQATNGPESQVADTGDQAHHLRRRVEALGPIAYPARVYDGVLGRLSGNSRFFLVLRFLLVITTVLLLVGGVNGEALVEYETGTYRTINDGGTINHYVTPTGPQQYLIDSGVGAAGQVIAVMGLEQGTVRIPTLDPSGPHAYAFQIKLVRGDAYIRPELGLQRPDGSVTSVLAPFSDDGITIRYGLVPIDQDGTYKFVVKSANGKGRIDMHTSIASAPVTPNEQFRPDWLPLVGGVALGTVLLGAYTPGATALAQARRAEPERPYRMAQDPAAFADRVVPVQELDQHPDAKLAYRDE